MDNKNKIGKQKREKDYYLGVIKGDKGYEVYFINNSKDHIKSLIMNSPGTATFDDKPVVTSSAENKFENIKAKSYVFIEKLDPYYQSDFVTHYYFDIITEKEKINLSGSIGKRIGFMGVKIPILNKMGRIIYLH